MQVNILGNKSFQLMKLTSPLDIMQILEQRGSKCTCKIMPKLKVPEQYINNIEEVFKNEKKVKCGNYCKNLSSKEQKDII